MDKLTDRTEGRDLSDSLSVFDQIIPKNIVEAPLAPKCWVLSFLVCCLVFLCRGSNQVPQGNHARLLASGLRHHAGDDYAGDSFPAIGRLALIAQTVSQAVADEVLLKYLGALLIFALCTVAALGLHVFGTHAVLLKVLGRLNPLIFIVRWRRLV